jgi:2-polyprenyl-3-methyl-5-hydroxy-6-metoxy-1,4-benzoquinol methylase
MRNFDYQWKNLPDRNIEYNDDRIKEFLNFTKLRSRDISGKYCLDAGCGSGRYTYAMMKLGAMRVDSFDISEEGVKKCQKINPTAYVFDIMNLKPNPIYDFVLSWGVLHHTADPRKAFSKVASQVKKQEGTLHVMLYHKNTQKPYEEGRKIWQSLSQEDRIQYCENKVKSGGGTIHGWYDAFNPEYNFSFTEDEIKKWFEEEGFSKIKLTQKYNINMQGKFGEEKGSFFKNIKTKLNKPK